MIQMPIVDLRAHARQLGESGQRVSVLWQDSQSIGFLARGREYRSEFHINPSDEVMLMVKGEMRLHYRTPEGKEDIAVIPEGSTIFTPTGVPHSPRFPPDAFALIMERKRRPGEIDHSYGSARAATACSTTRARWSTTTAPTRIQGLCALLRQRGAAHLQGVPRRDAEAMSPDIKILTVGSCSHVREEHRGHVVVSGSYGGNYNAYNAAKHQVRAVIMNDAGRGKNDAGICGLAYLDRIGPRRSDRGCDDVPYRRRRRHPGAWRDQPCQPDGRLARLHARAERPGLRRADARGEAGTRRAAADRRRQPRHDPRQSGRAQGGVRRFGGHDQAGGRRPDRRDRLARGLVSEPANNEIAPVHAVFFSDAGGGKDGAGYARLADLERRRIPAATVSADSAPIGDSRAIHDDGIISHVNEMAAAAGAQVGMKLRDFIAVLIAQAQDRRAL
ncbi:MAG: hypothetical protein WDO24_02745 [Pseudomonadota bacterium]